MPPPRAKGTRNYLNGDEPDSETCVGRRLGGVLLVLEVARLLLLLHLRPLRRVVLCTGSHSRLAQHSSSAPHANGIRTRFQSGAFAYRDGWGESPCLGAPPGRSCRTRRRTPPRRSASSTPPRTSGSSRPCASTQGRKPNEAQGTSTARESTARERGGLPGGLVHVVALALAPGVLLGHLRLLLLRLLHGDALVPRHGRLGRRRRGDAPPAGCACCGHHQPRRRGTAAASPAADTAEREPESRAASRPERVRVHGQRSERAHGEVCSGSTGGGSRL
jgi:hypothetical protein